MIGAVADDASAEDAEALGPLGFAHPVLGCIHYSSSDSRAMVEFDQFVEPPVSADPERFHKAPPKKIVGDEEVAA